MTQSTSSSATVAQEILSFCTKCKIDLMHTVVAMQGDRVVKVQCKTCKGFHTYRAPKGVTEKAEKKPRKPRGAAAEKKSVEDEWTRLMKASVNQQAKAYNTKGSFKAGEKISHPTFGEGVVGKLIYPNKLEIVFQMDVKILIHAGAPAATA